MKSMYQQCQDGDISCKEYRDYVSINRGYRDFNEYKNEWRHKVGIYQSMSENVDCSNYLGIHISERLLSKIWNNVIRMSNGNRGYDFICGKRFKVDVKSSCLCNDKWNFKIKKNKITDYFLLLAFDNREDLNPLHIWLIKGEQQILCVKVNDRKCMVVSDNNISLFKKYEQTDKLDKLVDCCNTLKEE